MIIYKDIITGSELLTDAYKIEESDGILKVKGKLVTEKDSIELAGANPSAEEGGDDYEEGSTTGVDVVLANKLQATGEMAKKDYLGVFKTYIKKIAAKLQEDKPDRVDAFKKEVQAFVQGTVLGKWKEMKWEFFQGSEHFNNDGDEGMLVLMSWDEETDTPYLYYFKDGLEAEKV